MTQNRSTAVMQRRAEPHDSLDDFPTPCWATRALCEHLDGLPATESLVEARRRRMGTSHMQTRAGGPMDTMTAREPAANRGHMVRPLREYFAQVEASDIFDYGAGFPQRDYLFGPLPAMVDWTITNPPFRLAEQFIDRALQTSRHGVAMLVRSAFLEGVGRYRSLFSQTPPSYVLQFTERVVMHKGKLAPKGSTATAYCWLVWQKSESGLLPTTTQFEWIAPCRKRLERAGDYEGAENV